ncbi:hypothetical protein GCM10022419_046620 [Nonomuraea rosea]|uniref:Anti-sigma factor antagonist n=1 Tax=Nonomuraea rosea TaxID=638574 RepID=A0ABP6X764_9ACTN
MTPLTLTHQNLPGVTMIMVAGELDITNHEQLLTFMVQARQRPADQVVFDLTELRFMDSSGLRAVLACRSDALQCGGDVRVAAPRPGPAQLFEITGIDLRMSVHVTVEQALFIAMKAAEPAT